MPVAHGIGGRSDLPIPFELALYGAGVTVFLSFALLTVLWPRPRLRGDVAGRPLPEAVRRLVDAAATRAVLRSLVLALAVAVLFVAVRGPDDAAVNLAPYVLFVTFWVGLVPASLLLGPVWRVVNPLRLLHAGLARLAGTDPEAGSRPLPDRLGWWPAVGWLALFVWLELVYPDRAEPLVTAVFLVGYATANVVAATVYGARWFERGDGFEAYSALLGRLAPFGRRPDGRLVARNPLDGLAGLAPAPGLVALVVVLIGSTAFDGLTRTRLWADNVDPSSVPAGTAGLAACVGVVAALYVGAARLAARPARGEPGRMPGEFAHSIVPIAVGYTIAHYFSLFLFDGQKPLILASDPLGSGADYLGTADWEVDYLLVSTGAIAITQVAAIVAGHVLGVVAAHDRAVRLFPPRAAARSQYPLLAVMIAFTVGGVALLLGA